MYGNSDSSMANNDGKGHEGRVLNEKTAGEVEYLKKALGPVLVAGLAEICVRRPSDPIEYLGHWLLRTRYNEEFKRREIQAAEMGQTRQMQSPNLQQTEIPQTGEPQDSYANQSESQSRPRFESQMDQSSLNQGTLSEMMQFIPSITNPSYQYQPSVDQSHQGYQSNLRGSTRGILDGMDYFGSSIQNTENSNINYRPHSSQVLPSAEHVPIPGITDSELQDRSFEPWNNLGVQELNSSHAESDQQH